MNSLSAFFPPHLCQSKQRLSAARQSYIHQLDKNEQPDDIPDWIKMQVLQKTMNMEWNRYPDLDHADIEQEIAESIGLDGNQVVLGSGSATFITALLNFFGLQRRQVVIAQPSYSLFDYHCKSYGISYSPWRLNADLEYDEALLPSLEEGSILFIVSPNNPVGNTISRELLSHILRDNSQTLVVLDAVYQDFGEDDFHDLLPEFGNLIIMRSFSKELPAAGLRLGYVCGDRAIIDVIRKLMLPFTINALTLPFARHIMFESDFQEWAAASREQIKLERDRMYRILKQNIPSQMGKIYASEGNFLLIKAHHETTFSKLMSALDCAGIKVLETSSMPLLKNTFRVSVGSYAANNAVIECILSVLKPASFGAGKRQSVSTVSSPILIQ